jgi:hypothetical protein
MSFFLNLVFIYIRIINIIIRNKTINISIINIMFIALLLSPD